MNKRYGRSPEFQDARMIERVIRATQSCRRSVSLNRSISNTVTGSTIRKGFLSCGSNQLASFRDEVALQAIVTE